MRLLYCFLIYCLVPFVLLRLLWRSRKNKAYRHRWKERFGWIKFPKHCRHGIWVHTVSVGEVIAAAPLINAIHKQYPNKQLIVTTMTPTGSERVKALCPDSVFHVYTPYDLPGAVKRFLKKTKPQLLILMETELWPNILHAANKRGIPCLLANARLSEKSRRGYARFQPLVRNMLSCINVIAVQARPDAKRFLALGAPEQQMQITGSVKFDMHIPDSLYEKAKQLREQLGVNRPVFIAASTHEGEEEQVLSAFRQIKQQQPECLLVLVPRHQERFNKIAQLCESAGYQVVRRSENKPCESTTDIYLGDTMGELRLMLAASDIAFIGGSLIERGGHNMLEAAAFSIPVISGPHVFNFLEITRLLNEAKALVMVENDKMLAQAVCALIKETDKREAYGRNGKSVVEANRGALDKHLQIIANLL